MQMRLNARLMPIVMISTIALSVRLLCVTRPQHLVSVNALTRDSSIACLAACVNIKASTSWSLMLAYDVPDSCDTTGKSRGKCDYSRFYNADLGCCLGDDDVCKFHGILYHTRCCSGKCRRSNGRCAASAE